MKRIEIKAPAKVNLFLNAVGRREDGYHLLENVMQTIDLFDDVIINLTEDKQIRISCDNKAVPDDESNIVYKCAKEVLDYKKVSQGMHIHINKRIPMEAGLGGGSSDGAAVINGLDKLLNLELTYEEKIDIAKKVGADIPFLICGGTALAEGIGEKITKIKDINKGFFLVVKPLTGIKTCKAFKLIDEKNIVLHANKNNIISAVNDENITETAKSMRNIFEYISEKHICDIKRQMQNFGAINSMMTGSGSAIFGIFENQEEASAAKEEMAKGYKEVFLCRPYKMN